MLCYTKLKISTGDMTEESKCFKLVQTIIIRKSMHISLWTNLGEPNKAAGIGGYLLSHERVFEVEMFPIVSMGNTKQCCATTHFIPLVGFFHFSIYKTKVCDCLIQKFSGNGTFVPLISLESSPVWLMISCSDRFPRHMINTHSW